ncbi:MAG: hypothetical protein VKL39_24770 [Leptolyngbyaceae bacterium]|nr:hypothetical protein [Leptolyngbyaceae bacterium]
MTTAPFPVIGVSERQAPVAHRITELLSELAAVAAAAADNAIDEGQPINPELVEAWQHSYRITFQSLITAANQ